jgi:hypothetical protein
MGFLDNPESGGATGALMDEYAKAAGELCAVVETFDAERFAAIVESEDPDTISARRICQHVGNAAFGYATDIAQVLKRAQPWPYKPAEQIESPTDLRRVLVDALRFTEAAVEPLRTMKSEQVEAVTFRVSWGTLHTPESMLEHAICHVLRHRLQLERWA